MDYAGLGEFIEPVSDFELELVLFDEYIYGRISRHIDHLILSGWARDKRGDDRPIKGTDYKLRVLVLLRRDWSVLRLTLDCLICIQYAMILDLPLFSEPFKVIRLSSLGGLVHESQDDHLEYIGYLGELLKLHIYTISIP